MIRSELAVILSDAWRALDALVERRTGPAKNLSDARLRPFASLRVAGELAGGE